MTVTLAAVIWVDTETDETENTLHLTESVAWRAAANRALIAWGHYRENRDVPNPPAAPAPGDLAAATAVVAAFETAFPEMIMKVCPITVDAPTLAAIVAAHPAGH